MSGDWYSDAREADGRTDEEVLAEIRLRQEAAAAMAEVAVKLEAVTAAHVHGGEWCAQCVEHGVAEVRREVEERITVHHRRDGYADAAGWNACRAAVLDLMSSESPR